MSGKFFVDSNVLIYAHDASAGERHRKARDVVARLWEEGSGVISTQVLQEFYVNLIRKVSSPPPRDEIRQWIADYLHWEVIVNDGATILDAMDLQARYRLSFWDSLILQAANLAGAEVVYSEDLNHGQRYGDTMVQNPFL